MQYALKTTELGYLPVLFYTYKVSISVTLNMTLYYDIKQCKSGKAAIDH